MWGKWSRELFAPHVYMSMEYFFVAIFPADPARSGPRSDFCAGCAIFGGWVTYLLGWGKIVAQRPTIIR